MQELPQSHIETPIRITSGMTAITLQWFSLPNNPIGGNTTTNTKCGGNITFISSNPASEGKDSSISNDVASESSSSDSPSDSGNL